MSPDTSDENTWEIVLTANKAVEANDEVLLSYGERSNDEFFGAYGFVPPRNPHEEMVLFGDIIEALEWHHHFYPPPVSASGRLIPRKLVSCLFHEESRRAPFSYSMVAREWHHLFHLPPVKFLAIFQCARVGFLSKS